MHVIHYWPCIGGCGKEMDSSIFDRFFSKGHMKCPESDNWRKVIDNKLPHCKSSETDQIYETLKNMGLAVNGSHSLFDENGRSVEGMSVIRVNIIEDTLEELMKHQKVDGAKFHGYNEHIMCPECIAKRRKEDYDGTEKVPEIKCPICEAPLVLIHQNE